jgi:hypothetical protein
MTDLRSCSEEFEEYYVSSSGKFSGIVWQTFAGRVV